MSNVKSMENLEKLEQLVGKIPARHWAFYATKLRWSKSKVYEYFNSLEMKKRAYSKNGLWYLETVKLEKPSTDSEISEKRLGFFEWLDRRAERKRFEEEERRLAAADESDMLADMFPILSPLKAVSKMTRKQIKESRKQRQKKSSK